jgi:hypothetical protein
MDVVSVQATDVPALQAAVPGFALGNVTAVQRGGGNAVLVTYQAMSPPSQVTGAACPLRWSGTRSPPPPRRGGSERDGDAAGYQGDDHEGHAEVVDWHSDDGR